MDQKPTNQELRDAYSIFEKRLLTAFGFYAWLTQISPRLEDQRSEISPYLTMTQNATVMGALVCIRSLDDFFLHPRDIKSDDDIVAHDFGFARLGSPLGLQERRRINRQIVHMSYAPIWDSPAYLGPHGDGSFDYRTLLSKVVPRCLQFMDFIISAPIFSSQVSLAHIRKHRRIMEVILGNVQQLAKMSTTSPEPTPGSVTPAAGASVAPPPSAAQL